MLDVRTKASLVVLFCVCGFTLPTPIQAGLILVVVFLPFLTSSFRFVSGRAATAYRKYFAYAFTLTTVLILLNGMLIQNGSIVQLPFGLHLYESGLLFGLRIAVRLLLLSLALLIFFLSTNIRSIAVELQRLGLPSQVILPSLLAFQFVDQLPIRIERIFAAQEARGAPVRSHMLKRIRSLFTILSPLVLESISESIERGTALELRGFRGTSHIAFQPSEERVTHPAVSIILLSVSLILVLWRIFQWLLGS